MPRRSHKKSRSGCRECKKRHIKCDENKPRCVNCVTANTSCSFEETAPSRTAQSTPQSLPSHPSSDRENKGSVPATPNDASMPATVSFDANLNMDHLELLLQWESETCHTLVENPERERLYMTTVVREALKFPFLMYQILAIAALHLASNAPPDQAPHHYHRATELQTAAVAGFKAHQAHITEESAFALLVFASLLGLHVLADHSRTYQLDNQLFLNHFLHTVRLMQGVHALVINDWWQKIRDRPDVGRFIDVESLEPPYNSPQEVKQLKRLVENPDKFDSETLAAYTKAIHHLDWFYALCKVPFRSYNNVHLLPAWPIRSSVAYLNLVEQRQPEALIILAYFALAVHFYRDSWMVRDTGIRLLTAIEASLDPSWKAWLDWPRQLIATTSSQDRDRDRDRS